jgi:retinol dehydrogenase 12
MGGIISLAQQSFPPSPTWSVNDIPDLSDKIFIVTGVSTCTQSDPGVILLNLVSGGNAGIGKETIKVLLTHNAKVYLAARSATKANAAIAELKDQTGKEAIFLQLDLSDISSVRKSAKEFLS